MIALFRKHPLTSYFVLAFLLSWGGILAVIRGGSIPAPIDEADRLFALVYLAMLAGPSVAGLVMTALTGGLADYRARLFKYGVEARWFWVALATAPAILLIAVLMLLPLSADFVPGFMNARGAAPAIAAGSAAELLITGLLVGLGAGLFEELGWTGFALPRMRDRFGVVRGALLLGILWGAWHFLAILWGGGSAFGTVPIALYLAVALFSFLPPYRILMALVYERTRSVFVAIVMHASLTASMLIFGPAVAGGDILAFDLVFAALLWIVVGVATLGRWRVPVRSPTARIL